MRDNLWFTILCPSIFKVKDNSVRNNNIDIK